MKRLLIIALVFLGTCKPTPIFRMENPDVDKMHNKITIKNSDSTIINIYYYKISYPRLDSIVLDTIIIRR